MNRHATALVLGCALVVLASGSAAAEEPPAGQPEVKPAEPPPPAPRPLPELPPTPESPPPLVAVPPGTAGASNTAAGDDNQEPPSPEASASELAPARRPRFGDRGQVVLSGSLDASFGHLGYSSGSSANTSFNVQPAFEYFSSDNFSQGVSAYFAYSDSTSGIAISEKSVSYGVTGTVGSNLWLGDVVSLWPRLLLGVWQTRSTFTGLYGGSVSVNGTPFEIGGNTEVTQNALFVELYAPFLFHLAPHFFVGIGPEGYADVLHSANSIPNKREFLGASSMIGGWF